MIPRSPHTRGAHPVRNSVIISTAAIVGLALGNAGVSLALWNDGTDLSGRSTSGYEYFAAGHTDATTPAHDAGAASVTIGESEARTLLDEGAIAIPLQTDSLSQGNKGLRYTVAAPDWGNGIFGSADPVIFPVSAAAECAVENAPAASGPLSSTPISAAYSDATSPVTEHWCVVAVLGDLPDEGAYTNIAAVTAVDEAGAPVEMSDGWDAIVTTGIEPADEADHIIEFAYETFRP